MRGKEADFLRFVSKHSSDDDYLVCIFLFRRLLEQFELEMKISLKGGIFPNIP